MSDTMPLAAVARLDDAFHRIDPSSFAAPVVNDAFDHACRENRAILGTAGDNAFRAGTLVAASIGRLLKVILPYWRPSRQRPHKGSIMVPIGRAHKRLPERRRADFFAVQATTPDQRTISGRTIRRVLQVVGAAHYAAEGDGAEIEALILALFGEDATLTPAGLLERAKKTLWGKVLGRGVAPAKVRRARLRRRLKESLVEDEWPAQEIEGLRAFLGRFLARTQAAEPTKGRAAGDLGTTTRARTLSFGQPGRMKERTSQTAAPAGDSAAARLSAFPVESHKV